DEKDVGLGDLDVVGVALAEAVRVGLDPLVVVVDSHRQSPLGAVLAHHILLEEVVDLARLGTLVQAELAALGELLLDDLVAAVDALVADVDPRAGDELLDLLLRLAAERALEQVAALTHACHRAFVLSSASPVVCPGCLDGTCPSAPSLTMKQAI